jgi:hypothetical protein
LREYYANRKKNALWNIGSVKQPARKPMARRRSAALQKLVGVGLIAPKAGGVILKLDFEKSYDKVN